MLRITAFFIGVFFALFGIMGFIPDFVSNGRILDIFQTNFEHNILHLVTGIIAVLSSIVSRYASKMYFIFLGAVYTSLALFGFMAKTDMLFDMIAINPADNFLHLAIAAASLSIGFLSKES